MEQSTTAAPRPRRKPAKPKTWNWRLYALVLLAILLVTAVILRLTEKPAETVSAMDQLTELAATAKASVALPAGYHRQTMPDEALAQGTLVLVNNDMGKNLLEEME